MDFSSLLLVNAAVIAGCMFALWLISLWRKDASIVDLFWGLGFVVVAWVSTLCAASPGPLAWLTTLLVTIWGCRLAGYLAWRNLGHGEDKRYAEMRNKPDRNFALFSLVVVFGLQGTIMWNVSLPLQILPTLEGSFSAISALGLACWGIGLAFESLADYQLARFKANASDQHQVLDQGLWRYTRHPNYFGDFLVWWGFFLLVLSADSTAWWTAIGPALMTFCLLYFSGVAHLEKRIQTRRPEYADYIRRTSPFFPWPPASHSESRT
ncbi:DUF1295 domain-containing protein [Blastopirellula marina]|uniref:Uncharacterized protein n=1 Tax=Blastopirellula marina TaxID=124 RepID=A0A2S8FN25_9BACT|nr:DUF1295 domain-containing protein [Blastopirellula marina]PQO33592.1 hypothetical protein C5Y98_15230 [Blastopirellula marina]PTL43379.1 DUF1295 domain-containing protein [Blastopirellula marina]